MKRKEAVYKGLQFVPVWFEDASATSPDYFQISEFPTRLTAGKNLFKLRGNPTALRPGSFLNIEVLDYNGNPIYSEVIDYIDEDKSRVVAIYVYEETSPGNCTVTLIGDSVNAPADWQGKPNVKWSRSVPVNPNVSNTSEIIFETTPTLVVQEQVGVQLDRTYGAGGQFPTYNTGTVKYFTYNGQPAVELAGGLFTNDMSTGTLTVTAPVNPAPTPTYTPSTTTYTSTIKKILSSTVALLDTEYTVYSSQSISGHTYSSFDASAYSISYEATPTYVATQNSESFALMQIKGLEPATGDVSRIKVFMNNNGTVGTWELLNDVELEETEIFVSDTSSLFPDVSIGSFTSQSVINTYWEGVSYVNGISATAPTLTWSTASLNNAMQIQNNVDISAKNSVSIAKVKSAYNGIFIANSEYKVTIDAIGALSGSGVAKLSLYMSGSAFDYDATDYFNQQFPIKFGKRLGELTISQNSQRYDDVVFNFETDREGVGTLLLVVESGTWEVADVRTTTDNDSGYSPNYTRLRTLVPTAHKSDNQLTFKAEYYNVNGEKSKQISYVYNKTWEGGNRYIDGDYSMLTGSLYVADSLQSGVAISGYKNTGFVRSLGYEGYAAGYPGFLLWSGSALAGSAGTKGGAPYSGVGLELYANTASYFRYSTTDNEIEVRTDKFFFGNPNSTFISGSNGQIQISSSNFVLSPEGNVTASNALFSGVALANIIRDVTIDVTTALTSSYMSVIDINPAPGPGGVTNAVRLHFDGSLGGEAVRRLRLLAVTGSLPIGDIVVPADGKAKTEVVIENGTSNQIAFYATLFANPEGFGYPYPPPIVYLPAGRTVTLSTAGVFGTEIFQTAGSVTILPHQFKQGLVIGTGSVDEFSSDGGRITINSDDTYPGGTSFFGGRIILNQLSDNSAFQIRSAGVGGTGFFNALTPFFGIYIGTSISPGSDVYVAFSGSANGNQRRTAVNSGLHMPYSETAISYTIDENDYTICTTGTSAAPGVTVTLPSGSTLESGRMINILHRKTAGLTIVANTGTSTIDGDTALQTSTPSASIQLQCNGTNTWRILSITGSWT